MKFILTICLLLISTPAISQAQRHRTHRLPRSGTDLLPLQGEKTGKRDLTRAQKKEAERRLSDMGYWTGAVNGLLDTATRSALIAFQKYEGRAITGQLTVDELEAIRVSAAPKAREPGYDHVEVDLDRQVLLIVNDEGRVRVLPVSTGSNKTFGDEDHPSVAYTPRGRFVVYDKSFGWENGQLGSVYYANYISGGVAIHGFLSVPTEPASHGCIRIPMFAAREVSKLLKLGTIVLVYDKLSFVSAKDWVENPKRKEAAMLNSAATDYVADTEGPKTKPVNKKGRSRIIRT